MIDQKQAVIITLLTETPRSVILRLKQNARPLPDEVLMAHVVKIDTSRISDWNSLHEVFAEALSFDGAYRANMNSWITYLDSLDEPSADKTKVKVAPGEIVLIELSDASDFSLRCEDLYDAIVECAAFINYRRLERKRQPLLALAYFRSRS